MVTATNDHELVIDGVKKGLNLLRGSYTVQEEVPDHQSRINWLQRNWVGGHGQYGMADPSRYFSGQSIDTTQPGRVFLGPLITEIYQLASGVQETYWANGDSMKGCGGNETWSQTFTPAVTHDIGSVKLYAYYSGNPGTVYASIRATSGGVPTGPDLCMASLPQESLPHLTYGTVVFTFSTPVTLSSGTMYALVLRVPSGSGSNYVGWYADSSSPAYAGGSAAISYSDGVAWSAQSGVDMYFEEWSVGSAPLDSAPTVVFWSTVAGKLLCADSGKIYHFDGTGWTAAATTVSGVLQFVEYNGKIFAARGATGAYYYSSDGNTWTASTLDDTTAYMFLVAPNPTSTANLLWKANGTNEVKYTDSGINGGTQWSTPPAYAGDTTSPITALFLMNGQIMIGKQENLFNYDANGGMHPLMDGLKDARSVNNFKYVQAFQGGVYFSLGTGFGELIGGTPGVFQEMGPLQKIDDIEKIGVPMGLAADNHYLYAAMREDSVIHIYKGYPVGTGWRWCPWVYLSTNACTTLCVAQHSATDVRLWFGMGTHTGYVQLSDNPTTDPNARFAPSGHVLMSYIYGTNPAWDKMIQSILTETAGCAAGQTVTPKYLKDQDTSASTLASQIVTNGINLTSLTNPLSGQRFQFQLDLATNDSTLTPEVLSFTVRGTEKPEVYRVHEMVYEAADCPFYTTKEIRDYLRDGRRSTSLIKMADLRYGGSVDGTAGTDYANLVMLPGYPSEPEMISEKGREPELGIRVRFMEVDYP